MLFHVVLVMTGAGVMQQVNAAQAVSRLDVDGNGDAVSPVVSSNGSALLSMFNSSRHKHALTGAMTAQGYEFCKEVENDGKAWPHLLFGTPLAKRYEFTAKAFVEAGCKHVLEIGAHELSISQFLPPEHGMRVTELAPCKPPTEVSLQSTLEDYNPIGTEDCIAALGFAPSGPEDQYYDKAIQLFKKAKLSVAEVNPSNQRAHSTLQEIMASEIGLLNTLDFDMDIGSSMGFFHGDIEVYKRHAFFAFKDHGLKHRMQNSLMTWYVDIMKEPWSPPADSRWSAPQ